MDNVVERIGIARELAAGLRDGAVADFDEFSARGDLPHKAHAWPEIQTVLAAHRAGRAVLTTTRRPRRANMYEEFDAAESNGADDEGLDPFAFSYADLGATSTAQSRSGLSVDELAILAGCAVRHGDYRPGRDGCHVVSHRGHRLVLSPDAKTIISYDPPREAPTKTKHPATASATVELDPERFDPSAVAVSDRVLDAFCAKHGTDRDEARRELAAFMAWALAADGHRVAKNGCHVFAHRGFTVWVAPDGSKVTKYETRHIERTPCDVRDGVPSRFGSGRRR